MQSEEKTTSWVKVPEHADQTSVRAFSVEDCFNYDSMLDPDLEMDTYEPGFYGWDKQ